MRLVQQLLVNHLFLTLLSWACKNKHKREEEQNMRAPAALFLSSIALLLQPSAA
jgi:hypothetical protein